MKGIDVTDLASAETAFRRQFNSVPRWISRAPGRVNLIGEHTDYNDGYVLPMALERDTIVLAAPNGSRTMNWISTSVDASRVSIDLTQGIESGPPHHWSNYPRGVVAGFLNTGRAVGGFDAMVYSTIPIGGGVSSSAALEVATATLLEAILGEQLDPVDKALLCQRAEHEYAGVPCGIMDQFISTLAQRDHLMLLDCRSREPEQIRFADSSVSVLIINSNVKHSLGSSQYPVRRAQCEVAAKHFGAPSLRDVTREQLEDACNALDSVIYRRARHVSGEIERTVEMAKRIHARDWPGAGQLMYESHESLQHDFEVSSPELDAIVESARRVGLQGGVYGCRMTGGGFGGCAVALIETSAEAQITQALTDDYLAFRGMKPTIFSSRPAQGAGLLRSDDIATPWASSRS
jgi:galactokinase